MVKKRAGFHDLFAQIPDACWQALAADADARGESIAKRLTLLLAQYYHVPKSKIPAPKRIGRKPKDLIS